jgi:hypothetical protein
LYRGPTYCNKTLKNGAFLRLPSRPREAIAVWQDRLLTPALFLKGKGWEIKAPEDAYPPLFIAIDQGQQAPVAVEGGGSIGWPIGGPVDLPPL